MKLEFETYVVFVAFITSFFAVFLSNGVIIGVPAIAKDFAMNNVIQNWIPTILFLVVAIFTVPAGQISGKFGVKKSLLAGIAIFLIGSIGACLSFSTESFLIFRSQTAKPWKGFRVHSNRSVSCNIPVTCNLRIFSSQSRLEVNILFCNSIFGIVYHNNDFENTSRVENI